ncbi:MAG: hypothetical protein C0482_28780 [Gordonia sp.]|nr:hypothetical protein [Gordonia sp. (in: high G+C Gram-positive bacteria)]
MDLGLEGKVALVGGGSRGLGRGTAEVLAREGVKVAIYARSAGPLEEAAQQITQETGSETIAIPTDVRDPQSCHAAVDAVVERFGRLDILVPNLAGDTYHSDVLAASDDNWTSDFELYALSVIRMSRAAVPYMKAIGGGSIVNRSSCGVHSAIPEFALSEAIRLATSGFAKYLSLQVASDGIRVNSVLPGWIEGDAIDNLYAQEAAALGTTGDELKQESLKLIPMGRYGTALEVGSAVAFLSSTVGSYITGTNIRLDGGWAPQPTV